MFDIPALQTAVAEHLAEVKATNKSNRKSHPAYRPVLPNWRN